jgi:class 3 adenylate cyclase/pimeloyl-ACP methyl ester carboxylesterase
LKRSAQDTRVTIPETQYAWSGDSALAYQIVGDGPIDIVLQLGFASHLDLNWRSERLATFMRGLAQQGRLIVSDRRGLGLSERYAPTDIPPLEVTADDLLVVMEAAGSERAVILTTGWAGFTATYLAAAHPDRVGGVVLHGFSPTVAAAPDTPWVWTEAEWEKTFEAGREGWGRKGFVDYLGIDYLDDRELDWFIRWCGATSPPGAASNEVRHWVHTDVRDILPSIQTPTLILADPDSTDESGLNAARYLAERIPGSVISEFNGANQFPWYRGSEAVLDAVGRFVAGIREEAAMFDRVLATVLFTDIVDSTATAVGLGDRAWRALIERHHAIVRGLLSRFRGVEVDTAGDGFFATFDGPARAVRCAQAIIEAIRPLGLEVRAGIHTGEVETIDRKAGGVAVVIGARTGAQAAASEVLVSQTVKDLVAGAGLVFENAGEHALKGVPDRWRLYRVVGPT